MKHVAVSLLDVALMPEAYAATCSAGGEEMVELLPGSDFTFLFRRLRHRRTLCSDADDVYMI